MVTCYICGEIVHRNDHSLKVRNDENTTEVVAHGACRRSLPKITSVGHWKCQECNSENSFSSKTCYYCKTVVKRISAKGRQK